MTTDQPGDPESIGVPSDDASPAGGRPGWLIAVVVAVIVIGVVALIAVLATDGDDAGDSAGQPATAVGDAGDDAVGNDDGGGDVGQSPASVGETRPVVISGEPLPAHEAGADDPAVGTPAPVIDGETFDGSAITVGGGTGSPTMIVYVAHWCPHCNDEIPELVALAEEGALPDELNVVAVSTAVREGEANYPPSQWLAELGWPWPAMVDDPDATAFLVSGGSSFPYTVMLDADGTVIGRSSGARSADEISAWIDETLG